MEEMSAQMSTAMMSAPSRARRTAWALPWPRAAPVMKATRPSSDPISGVLPLLGRHATVDHHVDPGDERRLVRSQEQGHGDDVSRFPRTLDEVSGEEVLAGRRVVEQEGGGRRGDGAGADAHHPDAERRSLHGQLTGHGGYATLCRAVRHHPHPRLAPQARVPRPAYVDGAPVRLAGPLPPREQKPPVEL